MKNRVSGSIHNTFMQILIQMTTSSCSWTHTTSSFNTHNNPPPLPKKTSAMNVRPICVIRGPAGMYVLHISWRLVLITSWAHFLQLSVKWCSVLNSSRSAILDMLLWLVALPPSDVCPPPLPSPNSSHSRISQKALQASLNKSRSSLWENFTQSSGFWVSLATPCCLPRTWGSNTRLSASHLSPF